ncbi:MAG: hypothetical protein GJ680_07855 [Alteromonadaceae bacterium]|nr:hypothetical protein [Alteromonadaceae bacterium]
MCISNCLFDSLFVDETDAANNTQGFQNSRDDQITRLSTQLLRHWEQSAAMHSFVFSCYFDAKHHLGICFANTIDEAYNHVTCNGIEAPVFGKSTLIPNHINRADPLDAVVMKMKVLSRGLATINTLPRRRLAG